MMMRITNTRRTLALVGLTALLVTGCSAQPAPTANDEVITEACQVIVGELKTTGISLADLLPKDLTTVDSIKLSDLYEVGAQALTSARGEVSDVKVGEIIDTAATAMKELSPIVVEAASGNPVTLGQAAAPLAKLGVIAAQCSTAVLK